ncbi:MAG: DMT family transporter [bacterium]|nr:DMT family transporter [bacterium]
MEHRRGGTVLPLLALTACAMIWGGTFIAAKVALRELGPLALSLARFLVAVAIFIPVAAWTAHRGSRPTLGELPLLALMGFLGVAAYYLLQFEALQRTTATNVSLLISLTPVWTVLVGRWWLREGVTPRQVAGMAVALAGAALVATGGQVPGLRHADDLVGAGLTVLNTLAWAVYTAAGRRLVSRHAPLALTSWVVILGTALLVPPVLATGAWRDLAGLAPATWAAATYLGLLGTVAAYSLWHWALESLPAGIAAPFLWLIPLVAIALAIPLLGERPPAATLGGAAAILTGLAVLTWGGQGRTATAAKAHGGGRRERT